MWKKIKYIFGGFVSGILLCLGIAWRKKNDSGNNGRINSADTGVDLSALAELVTERNNRNIEKLRSLGSSLDREGTGGDSQRIRELVGELRAEQDGSNN